MSTSENEFKKNNSKFNKIYILKSRRVCMSIVLRGLKAYGQIG